MCSLNLHNGTLNTRFSNLRFRITVVVRNLFCRSRHKIIKISGLWLKVAGGAAFFLPSNTAEAVFAQKILESLIFFARNEFCGMFCYNFKHVEGMQSGVREAQETNKEEQWWVYPLS